MALTGLVNLTDRLLNQTQGQPQGVQAAPQQTPPAGKTTTLATPVDQFTPSAQNEPAQAAETAGLFAVGQTALFSAAGDLLLAHASLQANPASAPVSAANLTPLPTIEPPAANAAAGPLPPATTAPLALAASANANNGIAAPIAQPTAAAPAPVTTSAANIQDQLEALNNSLASLGLTAADIQRVDRIASLTNEFNPAAFASLAYQLELQAQNSSAPNGSAVPTGAGNEQTVQVPPQHQAANVNLPADEALAPTQIKATA